MRKLLIALLLTPLCYQSFSQEQKITTFILVRHAEKDLSQSTKDPDLSAEGKARATRLLGMLKQTDIQALYSTDVKRTRQTVEPLSQARSLVVSIYDPRNTADMDKMFQQNKGGTVVVTGHSNTIPQFVNYLIGEEKYKPMDDTDYDNLIIVSVTEIGKNAKVVWLKY